MSLHIAGTQRVSKKHVMFVQLYYHLLPSIIGEKNGRKESILSA